MKSFILTVALTSAALFPMTASAQQTDMPEGALQQGQKEQSHEGHGHDHDEEHAHEAPEGVFIEVDGDHAVGSADAPVTLIMYASVTCPHCAAWFNNYWPAIKRDYVETEKLRFIFREFPTSPTQLAVANFALAACAPKDQYFENIEYQMRTQAEMFKTLRDETLSEAEIVDSIIGDRATKAGVLEAEIQTCLSTQVHYDKINADMARANAAGVTAVPGILINGELYTSKDSSAEALSTAIDAIIAP